jgi:hypothetical protein
MFKVQVEYHSSVKNLTSLATISFSRWTLLQWVLICFSFKITCVRPWLRSTVISINNINIPTTETGQYCSTVQTCSLHKAKNNLLQNGIAPYITVKGLITLVQHTNNCILCSLHTYTSESNSNMHGMTNSDKWTNCRFPDVFLIWWYSNNREQFNKYCVWNVSLIINYKGYILLKHQVTVQLWPPDPLVLWTNVP